MGREGGRGARPLSPSAARARAAPLPPPFFPRPHQLSSRDPARSARRRHFFSLAAMSFLLLRGAAAARPSFRAARRAPWAAWPWSPAPGSAPARAPSGSRSDLSLCAITRPCSSTSAVASSFSGALAASTRPPCRSVATEASPAVGGATAGQTADARRGSRRGGGGGSNERRGGGEGGRGGRSSSASGSSSKRYALQVQTDARHVTRRDLVQLFSGCGVSASDVQVEYSPETHLPRSYWVSFPGEREREHAKFRDGQMLGPHKVRLSRRGAEEMEAALRRHAPLRGSLGRFVIVSGLERSVSFSDLRRFFEGFKLRAHAISFLSDVPALDWIADAGLLPGRCALVRLATPAEAQRAARSLQWGHVLNSKVLIRVVE